MNDTHSSEPLVGRSLPITIICGIIIISCFLYISDNVKCVSEERTGEVCSENTCHYTEIYVFKFLNILIAFFK